MPVDDTAAAVLGAKLDMLSADIGRRLDEQRDDIRLMRSELPKHYVGQQAYQAEYGRLSDRIQNVEADVIEIRTTINTSLEALRGHLDRKFAEQGVSRRWMIGLAVTVALGLLSSATAVVIAVIAAN
jgi:hypothetical protein